MQTSSDDVDAIDWPVAPAGPGAERERALGVLHAMHRAQRRYSAPQISEPSMLSLFEAAVEERSSRLDREGQLDRRRISGVGLGRLPADVRELIRVQLD